MKGAIRTEETSSKDFYKRIHPDLFSDTTIKRTSKTTREMVDYHLEKITNKSQEYSFQEFCRVLAEREICPNLIPQTGPTGHGDSKVDSETYPVSDATVLTWFGGFSPRAAKEKWAFAMSATKQWKAKLKKDIENAKSTNRDYTELYFFTNQYISDLNKSKAQDEFSKTYGIGVHIMDKTWILNKLFSSKHLDLLVKYFSFNESDLEEEKEIGAKDLERQRALEKCEKILSDNKTTQAKLVDAAWESALLSRELELPYEITNGRFIRLYNLVNEHGLLKDKFKCLYDWAWTIHNWYNQYEEFAKIYAQIEAITKQENNFQYLEQLTNLYGLLQVDSKRENILKDISGHTKFIFDEYEQYAKDAAKPHMAFSAKVTLVMLKSISVVQENQPVDISVDDYIELFKDVYSYPNFKFNTFKKIICDLPYYKNAKRYDELFEIIVNAYSSRKEELASAQMLFERGKELFESNKPYKAITYYSRALMSFYKEESKDKFISIIACLGMCFERVELLWSARQYYMTAMCLSIKYFCAGKPLHPAYFFAAKSLKMLEILLGRVIYSAEISNFEQLLSQIEGIELIEEGVPYDMYLAIQVLKTDFEKYKDLEQLPQYFAMHRLDFAEIACKHLLGYTDEEMEKFYKQEGITQDEYMGMLYHQPARLQMIGESFYGFENTYTLRTKILGSEVHICTETDALCMEVASSVIAGVEGVLATAFTKIMPIIPLFKVRLTRNQKQDGFKYNIEKDSEYGMSISIGKNYDSSMKAQSEILKFIFETSMVVVLQILSADYKEEIEKMIKEENLFERSLGITANFELFFSVLGKDFSNFNSAIKKEFKCLKALRTEPIVFFGEDKELTKAKLPDNMEDIDLDSIKHGEILTTSIIDVALWDNAKWTGTAYLTGVNNEIPPAVVLSFQNIEYGRKIFDKWLKEIGNNDEKDAIMIGFIKQIDKANPCYYRVVVTAGIDNERIKNSKIRLVQNLTRMHTMEVQTYENINRFESAILQHSKFALMLGEIDIKTKQFKLHLEYLIVKNKSCLLIKDATDVLEEDFAMQGIMPQDNPIVNSQDAPIMKWINKRRKDKNDKL